MKKYFILLIVLGFCFSTVFSQVINTDYNKSISKSTKDWSYTIDTTWGAGLSTAQKLYFFDNWWYRVDQTWGGFPNLIINWDSLKNFYRPIIESGVSRGRFMGIMGRLTRALSEEHAPVVDPNVDVIYGIYYTYYGTAIGYPNYPTFHYKKGIPLLNLSYQFRTCFGAGVTAYNDSIALIYSVMPNHPLNLQPGDIILGYDGLPWKQNLEDLIDQELPLLFGTPSSSSSETFNHVSVLSAGMNWGLFDTIDILKYSTGDTVHYPTSLLSSITQPYFIATEQLPINGVPFPNLAGENVVSWGVVEGTSIGYIHVWNWYTGNVTALFEQAVDELMHVHNVTGLILDFRVNQGGYPEYANGGCKHLFNEDPTSNFWTAQRVPGNDHFLFNILPTGIFINHFTPTPELFDHPIAVLTGPICASAGDMNAFRMRFHPMVRFFGKKTMGAFTSYDSPNNIFYMAYDYKSRVDNGCMYSNYNNEGYLIHKGNPVDEEVWLTRDGVATGQDDVVNRALEWINNVVYPHNIISDETYYSAGEDTVEISTVIENPNQHLITARGYIHNFNGVVIDSVDLTKQVSNLNSENWKGSIISPSTEDYYKISVKTFDQTVSDQFNVTYASRFTTAGPLKLNSIAYVKGTTNYYNMRPFVRNDGTTLTITNAKLRFYCDDPWVTSVVATLVSLDPIAPAATVGGNTWIAVNYDAASFPGYFNMRAEISRDGFVYWTDTMRVTTNFQLTISVANGWNMVSIPGLHPVNQNVLTWWPGKDPLAEVFMYGGLGYIITNIAIPGEGYWMKHSGSNVYNTGDEWPLSGIQFVLHNPITANTGWNLIGGYEQSVSTAGLTTNPPGLITGPVFKYSDGYQVATTIDPGYGYWVKLTAAGQIIIPESLAKGEMAEYFPEDWGRIVLTDAAGVSYTLYAVKGQVDLSQYELPPAPPEGMFDIRYSSGRIAEDLSSAIQIIEMQGITYPIDVRTEGLTITLQDETGKIVNGTLSPGEELTINNSLVDKLVVLSAEVEKNIPTVYSLEQNYPNPFNPNTIISYQLPTNSNVSLIVYDILGNELMMLIDEFKNAGKYQVEFNAAKLASGVYFYRLKAGEFISTKKMLLLK